MSLVLDWRLIAYFPLTDRWVDVEVKWTGLVKMIVRAWDQRKKR